MRPSIPRGLGPRRVCRWLLPALLCAIAMALAACGGNAPSPTPDALARGIAGMDVGSPAFQDGGPIPAQHSCDGRDSSPPLTLGTAPPGARSLALIMDDPDAPGGAFVHWVAFDFDADRHELKEGLGAPGAEVAEGRHGINDFGQQGYHGPCPPAGPAHTYRVMVFALDRKLGLVAGASATELLTAMRGNVLGVGRLDGVYARGE